MAKPKVLQILPELNNGGVERGTIDIARALVEDGLSAYVCSRGGVLVEELDNIGAVHISLPVHSKNPISILHNAFKLVKIIRENGINIVHARSRAPGWVAYLACKIARCHYMTTFHGAYGCGNALKRFYNSVMLKGDQVIAVSNYIKKHIETRYHYKSERLSVIPRGVDLNYFNPDHIKQRDIDAVKNELDIKSNSPILLLPARFTRLKGHFFLLEALRYLKNLDFMCVMVGKVSDNHYDYFKEIEQKITKLGLTDKVIIRSFTNNMPALYSASDLVLSTSLEAESFGRTIIEAQAMNKIVVATAIGAPIEIIDDKKTGFLVSLNCPSELADVIKAVLKLKNKSKITELAKEKVVRQYSLDQMCKATLDIYHKLARRAVV